MSNIALHGFPISTHVRTARLAFHEKGVAVDLHEVSLDDVKTAAYGEINPFHRMPALTHGALVLYQTPALLVYADAIGTGPSLEPTDPVGRARMWQYIGVAQDFLHPVGTMQLYFHSVLAKLFGLEPDAAIAAAAVEPTARHLDVLEAGLTREFLAGQALSHADLYCGAAVDYIARTRDGRTLVAARPRIAARLATLRALESFRATFAPALAGSDQG